jgi:flagellar hook-associated protein 1 FlgK
MSSVSLSASVSSLLLLEKQMGVISNNIANANTVGYTAESEVTAQRVTGGVGTGVVDLGTVDHVNQFLQAQVLQANATAAQATSFSSYYQNLQQVMGQITSATTGGNDISSQLASLQSSLSQLATTPQNSSLGNQSVADLGALTANLRSMSQQIQQLRSNADQQITQAVTDANTQLTTINSLNGQIKAAEANSQPTAGLSDQRSQALQSLTADIGVNYFTNANGAMQIFTTSGQALLVDSTVTPLSHTAVTVTNTMSYPSGGITGIMVGGNDITGSITTGSVAALISQRDAELPNTQNALNFLAQTLSAGLNAASNLGSASPPPSSLTSAVPASYQGTDPVTPSFPLTVRIAMVDAAGQAQSTQDVSFQATDSTVNDIMNDINTAFGTPVPPVASLNGAGQLVLNSTTAGQGIAVSTLAGSLNGTDFSSFFHLNDVVTGGSSASTITVNPAMQKNSGLLPIGTLNSTQPAPNLPFAGVGAGDGSTANAMSNLLLGTQTFTTGTATGTITFPTPGQAAGLAGGFVIQGATQPVQVSVTADQTLAQIAASINSAAASAGATGVSASVVGNGIYQLQVTNGGNNLTFGSASGDVLSGLGLSGSPTGYLGSSSATFGVFASNLIADVASRASTAQTSQTSAQTTLTALQSSFSNQSGVNSTQQLAQLSTLQDQYAASAHVLTTVTAMFNALIAAVGGTA